MRSIPVPSVCILVTAVILGVLLPSFTGNSNIATAQTAHRAHTTRKKRTEMTKKSSPYDGVPLKQATDKKQILVYYRQTALSPVHTHDFRLDGKSIFCLSFDSGSGACIVWCYVYIREGDKWLLAYQQLPPFHPLPDKSLIGIDFKQKGSSVLQVIGAYQITHSESHTSVKSVAAASFEYKLIKTISAAALLKCAKQASTPAQKRLAFGGCKLVLHAREGR